MFDHIPVLDVLGKNVRVGNTSSYIDSTYIHVFIHRCKHLRILAYIYVFTCIQTGVSIHRHISRHVF